MVPLIDSGADANLIGREMAHQLGVAWEKLPRAVPVRALDGHRLGTVTHQTTPVEVLLADEHWERAPFHILDQPGLSLVLGYPWLRRHNPHIDWKTGVILEWSPTCQLTCQRPGPHDA